MINLFEYQNKATTPEGVDGLDVFLDEIWNSRERTTFYYNTEDDGIESQRFIQFLRKSNEIKSNKYVGVIHFGETKINLLPKIFFEKEKKYAPEEIHQMQNHILWWLSYCRKIKFPNYQAGLGGVKSDFFEVLIYLFSKYTRELLGSSIYQQYQEVSQELAFIKGRLNVNEYINESLSKGRWHKLNCVYDAFSLDNEFNQIIKYVAKLLFDVTNNQDSKKNLREILFILDDVTDKRKTAEQCARIQFNPMFGAFETVRDYCQLFLSHYVSFDYKNDLKLFAFLLPMEYVFEDFVFGFIEKEIEHITAKAQISSVFLDKDKSFKLKPDLFLTFEQRALIADTKYKVVYSDEDDPKKGISQTDLYQMLGYAIRFNVNEINLYYPSTVSKQDGFLEIIVEDQLANNKQIIIRAFQLPIINLALLAQKPNPKSSLNDLFSSTRDELMEKLLKSLSFAQPSESMTPK